jgi:uncharacterized protein (DUF362 family)
MSRVYISRMSGEGLQAEQVLSALEWLDWEQFLPVGARVFIKPNLTWPTHLPGVTTTPRAIEAVVAALRKRTPNICIGESDGGYHSYKAEDAFRGHGLYAMAEQYGARVLNLSTDVPEDVTSVVAGRQVTVTLPRTLLHETDVFITMPVPKVHVMTRVSLGFKNQWGCVPSTMRLREHPEFDYKIVAINRLLKPRVIFDGAYFLDQAGPMSGEPVRMDLLIAGDELGAADAVCCAVMGMDPGRVRHYQVARRAGLFPHSLDGIALNTSLEPFLGRRFVMHRAFLDWLSLLGFRYGRVAWLFWESPAADLFHKVLYSVRRNPLVCRMLYGPTGSPPDVTALTASHTE